MDGYYYLHTNGDLIFKKDMDGNAVADFRDSDFVKAFWPLDSGDRESAWTILVEATALGAKGDRVSELASKWRCDDKDAETYARRVGCDLSMDGNQWCATANDFVNLAESVAGFGETCLVAMANLARGLGFRAQKIWGASFKDLLRGHGISGNESLHSGGATSP